MPSVDVLGVDEERPDPAASGLPVLGFVGRSGRQFEGRPDSAAEKIQLRECPGRGSNPHGPVGPEGFKPSASASSATRAVDGGGYPSPVSKPESVPSPRKR